MASGKRMRAALVLLQIHAALSGSSMYKSQYGTSVSAKGSLSHSMLMKEKQHQLLRKEADDDLSDLLRISKEAKDNDNLSDLATLSNLQQDDVKKSAADSSYDSSAATSDKESDDLLDTKDDVKDDHKTASKEMDDDLKALLSTKDSKSDAGDAAANSDSKEDTKDADSVDDAAQQQVTLAGLAQNAKDSQDGTLMKSLKADMAADNEAQTPEKDDSASLDQASSILKSEDDSWGSINADLSDLHTQVWGNVKAKKDTPSINSSVLQVSAAQRASEWLDKQLGKMGGQSLLQNEKRKDHSWLDEEYAKIQKAKRHQK